MKALIACCTYQLPYYAEDASVIGPLWKLSILCRDWLAQWLTQALSEVKDSIASQRHKRELYDSLALPTATRDSAEETVKHFTYVCLQNSRRWNRG